MHPRRVIPALLAAGIALLSAPAAAPAVSWTRVSTGTADSISAIDYRSPAQLTFATTAGNIFTRLPTGAFALQASFAGRQFSDIAFNPSGTVGIATADTGHLYRFANGVWSQVSLANATYNHDCPFAPEPPYRRATPADNLVAVAWGSDTIAYVIGAGTGEVFKTGNAGASWIDVDRQANGTCRLPATLSDLAAVPGNANDVYLIDTDAFLYRTSDGLASPAIKLLGMPTCSLGKTLRLALDPASPSRVSDVSACRGDWGFSHDAGSTADAVKDTSDDIPARGIAAGPGQFVVVGDQGKIERTFDGVQLERIPARGALAHENWLSVDLADRAHAAVGGVGGVLVVSANVDPRPTFAGLHIRIRRAGRRVRVRVRGSLRPPRGIDRALACAGKVTVTVKRGRRRLASRRATVHGSCRFAKAMRLAARRVGRARRLTIVLRFPGNAQLGPARRTVRARVRG